MTSLGDQCRLKFTSQNHPQNDKLLMFYHNLRWMICHPLDLDTGMGQTANTCEIGVSVSWRMLKRYG
jgi:hypothetical protein